MPALLRQILLSIRDFLLAAGPFVLIAAALLWVAYVLLDPAPPKRVVLATGPGAGRLRHVRAAYAQLLARHGIEVQLRATEGSAENLRLLRDRAEKVDLAFVQGGASEALYAVDEDRSGVPLVSIGSLFYEPVWIFYRSALRAKGSAGPTLLAQVGELAGLRVNLGPVGAGSRNLMLKLLHANRIEPVGDEARASGPTAAVVALLSDEIDALVLVSAPESPLVQMLLQTPGIRCSSSRRPRPMRGASPSCPRCPDLPRGVVDLARDVPPRDVVDLVAATSTLVAREGPAPGAGAALRAGGAAHPRRTPGWFGPRRRVSERRRPSTAGRGGRASTAAGRRCCSATCRSGSPT
jgi:hypothetical protein